MAHVFDEIPAQRSRIALDNPRELSWWSKRLGCSEQQLRDAVAQVGDNAAQVEQLIDGTAILTV